MFEPEGREDGFVHLQSCLRQCGHVIEKMRQMAASHKLGSEAEDLRDLSLTLATYDTMLYNFVQKLLVDSGQSAPRRNADLVEAVNGLRRRLAATPTKSLPLGGIVSVLHHMLSALDDTAAVLEDLRSRRREKVISAVKTAAAALVLLLVHRGVLFSAVHQKIRRSFAIVAFALLAYRRVWSLSIASRNIQACNRQLLILLRMWTLCQDAFGQATMSKVRSYPTLMAVPTAEDYEDHMKPHSRRLLEHTLLPQSTSVWIQRSRPLVLLRFVLEISYSCMHVGYTLRKRPLLKWLQWPAVVASGVYYTLRPAKASARALELTKAAHLPFIKYVWSFFDCRAARMAASYAMPALETFKPVVIDGVQCHLFADSPVSSTLWRGRGNLSIQAGGTQHDADEGELHLSASATYLGDVPLSSVAVTSPFTSMGYRSSSYTRLSSEWREHRHESITEDPDEDDTDKSSSTHSSRRVHSREQLDEGDSDECDGEDDGAGTGLAERHAATGTTRHRTVVTDTDTGMMSSATITPTTPHPPTLPPAASPPPGHTINKSASYSSGSSGVSDRSDDSAFPTELPVLLYIHGGGFLTSLFPTDSLFLARWAKQEGIVVVFVHYSLTPEARYPIALNECMAVYKWLRSHTSRIVVMGESAGGNIATALILRCISEGIALPSHLSLAYPALDLNHVISTSRAVHMNDPCLPSHLLTALANVYLPQDMVGKPVHDPLMSPSVASDAQLRQFPSTSIVVGGLDPLLDDSIDFHCRLRRAQVPVDMKVFRNLPHGFMGGSTLPVTRLAVETLRRFTCAPLQPHSSPTGNQMGGSS